MAERSLSSVVSRKQNVTSVDKEFRAGPLDKWRRLASFNYREMRSFVEGGDEYDTFKHRVWKMLEKDPLFNRENDRKLSMDGSRRLTMKRMKRLFEYEFLTQDEFMESPRKASAYIDAIGAYDWSLSSKLSLNLQVGLHALTSTCCRQYNNFELPGPTRLF